MVRKEEKKKKQIVLFICHFKIGWPSFSSCHFYLPILEPFQISVLAPAVAKTQLAGEESERLRKHVLLLQKDFTIGNQEKRVCKYHDGTNRKLVCLTYFSSQDRRIVGNSNWPSNSFRFWNIVNKRLESNGSKLS